MPRCLDGDVLRARLGPPAGPWRQVDVFEEVDSTNAYASAHPRPWSVVVADHQSGGRGRHGRPWSSPPGTSVAVSFVVPAPPGPARGWLPLVAGLAVRDAFARLLGDDAAEGIDLKWPNDVLVAEAGERADGERRKACGILCQVVPGDLVVVGIGVNVAVERDDLPTPTATSLQLAAAGSPPGREEVVVAVAEAFARRHAAWLDDPGGQRAAYRAACTTIGREVDLHLPGGTTLRASAVDVDDDGRLVVDDGAGRRAFAAADVVHARRARSGTTTGGAIGVTAGATT